MPGLGSMPGHDWLNIAYLCLDCFNSFPPARRTVMYLIVESTVAHRSKDWGNIIERMSRRRIKYMTLLSKFNWEASEILQYTRQNYNALSMTYRIVTSGHRVHCQSVSHKVSFKLILRYLARGTHVARNI